MRRLPAPWRGVTALLAAALLAFACAPADVTDTPAVDAVELTPPMANIEAGRTVTLTARPIDGNGGVITGRPVTWSSNNTQIATVSSAGVVTARGAGEARIAASIAGRSAVAVITVTAREVAGVQVTPVAVSVRVRRTAPLLARALDADGDILPDRAITWVSANPAVATIDAQGVVTAVAPGATTVTATSEGRSGQAAVTVTPEPVATVTVAPERDTLAVGTDVMLAATLRDVDGAVLTDRPVAWSVGTPSVASVSSTGVVTALAPGTTTVVAVSEGRVGQATIVVVARLADAVTLTPSSSTLEVGATLPLLAQVTDPAGNLLPDRVVTFTSDNATAATVTAEGVVTARAPGAARITAASEGRSAVAVITVVPVPVATVQLVPASADVIVGATRTLTAEARSSGGTLITGRAVTWTSGAPGIATVSTAGVVTGVSPGQAVIAAAVDGVTGFATITVQPRAVATVTITPAAPEMASGTQVQLTATVQDAAGATLTGRHVTWSSADETIAFVSSTGLVIALRPGTVTITATSEGVSGTTLVTVR